MLAAATLLFVGASPEVQLCLQHLRAGERARLEKAVGDVGAMPLYRAELEVDPAARQVKGRVVLTYVARKRALSQLHLLARPNGAEGARLKLSRARLNGKAVLLEQPEPTLFRIAVDPPLPVGSAAAVELELDATVPEAPRGSASLLPTERRRDYGAFMASPELLSLSGVVPGVAEPDGEEPPPATVGDFALYEPSSWLVSVVVPPPWQVIASGVALGEVPQKDGRVRFSFGAAAARDFPLFVARGYEVETAKVGDVVVESHFLPADAPSGKKALEQAASSLAELQKRLGPYPWTNLRVVEAPLLGGAGGMEFPGLVTISTGLYRGAQNPFAAFGLPDLPYLKDASPQLSRIIERTFELTVAHEVAHQYFAMLVGNDPLREPVVDESLAQAVALMLLEWRHGKKAADELKQAHLVMPYHLYRLMGGADGPADRPTHAFRSNVEYAALVYGKAPLLHLEMKRLVGEKPYLEALATYVETWRYKEACRDCFRKLLASKQPKHARALEKLERRYWAEARGDEDLGPPDLAKVLEALSGTKLDDGSRALLEQLMRQLSP